MQTDEQLIEAMARALVPVMGGDQETVDGRDAPPMQFDSLPADWQAAFIRYATAAHTIAEEHWTEVMVQGVVAGTLAERATCAQLAEGAADACLQLPTRNVHREVCAQVCSEIATAIRARTQGTQP